MNNGNKGNGEEATDENIFTMIISCEMNEIDENLIKWKQVGFYKGCIS